MAEASARRKLSTPLPLKIYPTHAPFVPFSFDDLPKDINANIWRDIRVEYELSLPELSALQNARCGQGNFILYTPQYTCLSF